MEKARNKALVPTPPSIALRVLAHAAPPAVVDQLGSSAYARQANADIHRHYLSLNRGAESISIFAGYGLTIRDDLERELDGLSFLARQAEHFRSLNDYLFIL